MKYDAEVAAAIARWAPVYGVTLEPSLIHAIIQRESSHGAKLETVESKGRKSYGPMMVLDTTAQGLGVTNPASLKDPGLGISIGVRYFASLLKKFPGDTARAISAYNTGPGNAVRSGGKFPNQSYVDSVTAWWKTYKYAVVGSGSTLGLIAILLFFWFQMRRGRGR